MKQKNYLIKANNVLGALNEYRKMLQNIKEQHVVYSLYVKYDDTDEKKYRQELNKTLKTTFSRIMDIGSTKCFNDFFDRNLEAACKKRRINTLVDYAVKNIRNNPDKKPYSEDVLITGNTLTHVAVLNERDVLLATTLCILDFLDQSGNLDAALILLPLEREDKELDEEYGFIIDASYKTDVILDMMSLIKHRDGNYDSAFYNKATLARTKDTVKPLEPIEINIPNAADDNDECLEYVNEIIDENRDISNRERFDKIISLISPVIIERAIKRFTDKLAEIRDLYETIFGYYAQILTENHNIAVKIIDNAIAKAKRDYDNQLKRVQNNNNNKIKHVVQVGQTNSIMHIAPMNINMAPLTTSTPASLLLNDAQQMTMSQAEIEMTATVDKINEQTCINEEIQTKMSEAVKYLRFGEIERLSKLIKDEDEEFREKLSLFSVDNPYEICFAFLMLFEQGSDIPWLVDMPLAVLHTAANQLPWTKDVSEEIYVLHKEAQIRRQNAKIRANDDCDNIHVDRIDDERKLYEPKFNDSLYWYLYSNKKPSKDILRCNNFTQLVYKMTGVIMPRNMYMEDTVLKALGKTGYPKKDRDAFLTHAIFCNSVFRKNKYNKIEDNKAEANIEELNDTIKQQKESIEQLEKSLYDVRKQLQQEQNAAQQAAEQHKLEKQELKDLRELVYKLQNKTSYEETTENTTIAFPYEAKRRIVIFGGHSNWCKAIKPMLKNVRFVDPYAKPDANLIRHADEVWIQTNAISHAFYYGVMNIVRQQKIPLQYFEFASAEKCALQLAKHDIEMSDSN